jgi:hypothetical protein
MTTLYFLIEDKNENLNRLHEAKVAILRSKHNVAKASEIKQATIVI